MIDRREGRPKTENAVENIDKIHNMILGDKHLKAYEIADSATISEDRVLHLSKF